VKVRITRTPREHELDGVRLDIFAAGMVREVSPSIGSWLIAQGYAEPEMRRDSRTSLADDLSTTHPTPIPDRRRRES
jgi:virulence-associated protein VagC